jgi:putative lipoprotein (rSAM/lipoprotein system)
MRKKLFTLSTKMLAAALTALGFAGCLKDDPGEDHIKLMYGTPSATFKVKGKVVSAESGTPVKNIRVVLVEVREGQEIIPYRLDTVYTHSGGEFSLANRTFPSEAEFRVKLEDIDGEENGLFESKNITVVFERPKFTNGTGWYAGETEKDLKTVELEPVGE